MGQLEGPGGGGVDRVGGVQGGALVEIAQAGAALEHDIARLGLGDAGEQLDQGGFPGPVAPHDADAVGGLDGERDGVEHRVVAVDEGQVGGGQDGHGGRV